MLTLSPIYIILFIGGNVMEKYVKYLRKSRFDRDYEDLSLDETLKRHDAILEKLAQSRGYYVAKTYYEVVSGESIAARPEVQKLLDEVGRGMYAGVLVVDVDRLARGNSIDQGIISQTFQYSGTKIITPNKIYDPSNEFDEEYFEFGLFMSRREYKIITNRLIRGRESSASEGKFVNGTSPYGYKRIKLEKEKGYSLEIVPEEAFYVKKIFDMYLDHIGIHRIADYLNELGVPTRSGNPWHNVTINYIINNPVYTGKIRRGYFKQKKTIENGIVVKKKTPKREREGYRIYDGMHQAIITEEMFDAAQKVRDSYTHLPRTHEPYALQNSFAGILYCAKCGKRMIRVKAQKGRAHAWLRCVNIKNCHNTGCNYDVVEEKILEAIRIWFSDYQIKLDTVGYKTDIDSLEHDIRQVSKEIEKTKAQLNKAFDLIEQGIYTLDVFQERRAKLTDDIDALEAKRSAIQDQISILQTANESQANLIPTTQNLLDNYDILTVKQKNEILKKILFKIEYSRQPQGEIEITLHPQLRPHF